MATPPELVAGSATGSIYDLGYRRYEGPRLGRRHAVRALFVHGLRTVFGLGRSGRAKVIPLALGGFIALPAIVSVGITAMIGEVAGEFNPITIEGYLQYAMTPLVLLVAAQAPELVVRDQRHRVLTLYFSRALERSDYVLAKLLALATALAIVLAIPQVVLLVGALFATPDLAAELAATLPIVAPAAARTAVAALLLAAIGLAASAFTARRPIAAATTIAVFLVVSGIVTVLVTEVGLEGPLAFAALLDPLALVDGSSAFFLGAEPTSETVIRSDLPVELFAAGAIVATIGALGLLLLRYRRITA